MMTYARIDDEDGERSDFDFEDAAGVDPAAVLPQLLTRLVPRHRLGDKDFIAATAALMLAFARGISGDCARRRCREQGICQRAPAACSMRRYADIYNWDDGLISGERTEMYEALDEKPADAASIVRQHTPDLTPSMLEKR
ncbi:MAG: hypothetical protein AB7F76_06290 [Parvibaculaceae bacterium]|jgi:hypothetical protein